MNINMKALLLGAAIVLIIAVSVFSTKFLKKPSPSAPTPQAPPITTAPVDATPEIKSTVKITPKFVSGTDSDKLEIWFDQDPQELRAFTLEININGPVDTGNPMVNPALLEQSWNFPFARLKPHGTGATLELAAAHITAETYSLANGPTLIVTIPLKKTVEPAQITVTVLPVNSLISGPQAEKIEFANENIPITVN
jgi:hypothetical protein